MNGMGRRRFWWIIKECSDALWVKCPFSQIWYLSTVHKCSMIWGDKYLVNGPVIDRRSSYDIHSITCTYGLKNLSGRHLHYYYKHVYKGAGLIISSKVGIIITGASPFLPLMKVLQKIGVLKNSNLLTFTPYADIILVHRNGIHYLFNK